MMNRLFYTYQAAEWSEALPLGNGRLGAMVFGNVCKDRIQLNEDTIWYGGPMDRINADSYQNLARVRSLIMEGEIAEAELLLRHAFTGNPQSMRHYQSGGDFWLRPADTVTPFTDYKRFLFLRDAVAEVTYKQGEVTYTRNYFISAKLQTLVVEITADREGAVNIDGQITRDKEYDTVSKTGDNIVMLRGNLGKGGLDFALAFTAASEGGTVEIVGENVVVRKANRAWFYVTEGTTFQDYLKDFETHGMDCNYTKERLLELTIGEATWCEHLEKRIIDTLKAARETPYEQAYAEHIKDHRSYYDRVKLEISPSMPEAADFGEKQKKIDREGLHRGDFIEAYKMLDISTDKRLKAVKQGKNDNSLWCLYFNFARYLLISGSRPGSMPLNLQGIWNDRMKPPWDSKYTININTEMNYWPSEICNLSEFHTPLFDLLRRCMKRGQKTAWEMYHCRGFVIHHNTDIWADTAPQDIWMPGTYWVMGGAWLCAHLWMHYEYTQDVEFLASSYDILEQAVLFFCDYLKEEDGKMILCPSVSPENTYVLPDGSKGCVCYNSSMDIMILRELLNNYGKASRILREAGKNVVQEELEQAAKELLLKLPGVKIGKYGQIMEWAEDYEEADPGHRHISHLYALHPGTEITVDKTPELAEAARVTIARRLRNGGGYTGWSCAWLINFYAKLWDGENAYAMLRKLLTESTYDNLMDNHPGKPQSVFQIDGNMGACAAIVNMLVQSNEDRVILLPACPKEWKKGSLSGVKVTGNALINVIWENNQVTNFTVCAQSDWEKEIYYNGHNTIVSLRAGEQFSLY